MPFACRSDSKTAQYLFLATGLRSPYIAAACSNTVWMTPLECRDYARDLAPDLNGRRGCPYACIVSGVASRVGADRCPTRGVLATPSFYESPRVHGIRRGGLVCPAIGERAGSTMACKLDRLPDSTDCAGEVASPSTDHGAPPATVLSTAKTSRASRHSGFVSVPSRTPVPISGPVGISQRRTWSHETGAARLRARRRSCGDGIAALLPSLASRAVTVSSPLRPGVTVSGSSTNIWW